MEPNLTPTSTAMAFTNESLSSTSTSTSTSHQSSSPSEVNQIVERILESVESRDNNQLSLTELEQLSILASNVNTNANANANINIEHNSKHFHSNQNASNSRGGDNCGWSVVDIDSLCTLMESLEEIVRNASRIDIMKYAREVFDKTQRKDDGDDGNVLDKSFLDQWADMNTKKNSPCLQLCMKLKHGLQAATILLSIMNTPHIDRRIMNEETIDAAVSLLRLHILRNVIPALSHSGHTAAYQYNYGNAASSSMDATDTASSSTKQPAKKRKRKSETKLDAAQAQSLQVASSYPTKVEKSYEQTLIKFLKKVYKPILNLTIGHLTLLMERIDTLIQSISLDDQPLLSISSAALATLTIDPIHDPSYTHVIQSSAIGIVSTVFRQNPRHRIVILDDLMPLYLKMPTAKKSIRSFPVNGMIQSHCKSSRNSTRRASSSVSSSSSSLLSPRPARGTRTQNSSTNDAAQNHIQVMTALILFLIQSCITMPIPKDHEQQQQQQQQHPQSQQPQSPSTTGLEQCEIVCKQFTLLLIQKCSKKGEDGGASEFRPILFNLVDDLLDLQLVPDFPAAEMLLMELCRLLSNVLLSNSSVSKNSNMNGGGKSSATAEITYLTTAMETIGTICADVAAKLVSAKENPLEFTNAVGTEELEQQNPSLESKNEINGCYCGKEKSNVFSLDCDRCHRWFHGNCLRIAKDFTPTTWYCDECKMMLYAMEQLGLNLSIGGTCEEQGIEQDDRVHIMRITLLNFISRQFQQTKSILLKDARQFHIAKFIKETGSKGRNSNTSTSKQEEEGHGDTLVSCAQYLNMWNHSSQGNSHTRSRNVDSSSACEYLSEAGNAKVMITLHTLQSELVISFPQLLGVLVALMGDEDIASLRKLAVKAVSQIVQVDSSLMSRKMIRDAVANRFNDEAISVREAVISLVGVYIVQVSDLAKTLHFALLDRLFDVGISVRKRAIRIFRDLIIANPTYKGRASVFSKLLQQVADRKLDDGVRDLIQETFELLWFSSTCSKSDSVGGVLTSVSNDQSNSFETAKQMIEVVTISPGSQESLACLVKEMLCGFNEGDKAKKVCERKVRQKATRNHCSNIVSYLFEELLSFEEKRAASKNQSAAGPRLVHLLTTISVFTDASPTLLLKHIDILLPYLKADNGLEPASEAAVVYNICKILSQLASYLTVTEICRLGDSDLPGDLIKITYAFGSKPTGAAVELLAKLATHSSLGHDSVYRASLMKLASIFYKLLFTMKETTEDFSKVKIKQRSNVQRAMSVLGSLCRYHDKEEITIVDNISDYLIVVDPIRLSWVNLPYAAFALLHEYLLKVDTITKCTVLRAMAGIFFSHPRIMLSLEEKGTLKDLMSEKSPLNIQLEALKCWQEILVAEEVRVESGEAKRQMESNQTITVSKKISGDQDGDASLIGACCIQHSSRLFQMTSSRNAEIREHSLRLIETLRRQGLMNPMELVPHLLALQGDLRQPQIRSLSLKLLNELIEKYPSIVRQFIADGIKQSYMFQHAVNPDEIKVTAVLIRQAANGQAQKECIFKDVFTNAIGSSRTYSKKTLKSLINLFSQEINVKCTGVEKMKENKIPLLSYITEVLASLPFNHLGDVIFTIHTISEKISLETYEVMRKITQFLHLYGLSSTDPDPTTVDTLEKASMNKSPIRTKDCKPMNTKSFDTLKFAELCTKASTLSLLMRLNMFLKEAYKVQDKRLLDYDPSEKERINDRGISINSNVRRFDFQLPNAYFDKSFDKDNLIRQYSIFRRLMRDYDTTFVLKDVGAVSSEEVTTDEVKKKRKLSDSE